MSRSRRFTDVVSPLTPAALPAAGWPSDPPQQESCPKNLFELSNIARREPRPNPPAAMFGLGALEASRTLPMSLYHAVIGQDCRAMVVGSVVLAPVHAQTFQAPNQWLFFPRDPETSKYWTALNSRPSTLHGDS